MGSNPPLNTNISQSKRDKQLLITAEKLGPIKKAEIRLAPLTIFFGRNNTGKTYLSYILWGILRSLRLQSHKVIEGFYNTKLKNTSKSMALFVAKSITNIPNMPEDSSKKRFTIEEGVSNIEVTSTLVKMIFNYHKMPGIKNQTVNIRITPPILSSIELSIFIQVSKNGKLPDGRGLADMIVNTLLRDLVGVTVPSMSKKERERYSLVSEDFSVFFEGDMLVKSKSLLDKKGEKLEYQLHLYIDQKMLNQSKGKSKKFIEELQNKLSQYLYWYIMNVALSYVIGGKDVVFIPASKSGLGIIRKDLYAKGVQVWLSQEKRTKKAPNLPYPLIDYLQNLALISSSTSKNTRFKKIVEFLEENLIQGTIYYDEQRDDIMYKPKRTQARLPMNITSSLVVETMPLITFLKHGIIKENNVVVLEEPESHLHPEAQRILARGIVKLINSGVYVVLVTHSPFIIQQINNNIGLYYLRQGDRQRFYEFIKARDWGKDEVLDPKKISAYLFDQDKNNKTIVRELTITPEEGISYEAFYEPLYKLRKETNELRNLIEEVRGGD